MKSGLISPDKWPVWAVLFSALMLAGAHAFERIAMFAPCPLCLRQREVYWAAITLAIIGIIAIRNLKNPRITMTVNMLLALIFLTGVVIATYHAGVEWKLWPGPTECSGAGTDRISSLEDLDLDQKFAVVSCSDAAWRMLGISMAGYNALISVALALASAFFAGLSIQTRSDRERSELV